MKKSTEAMICTIVLLIGSVYAEYSGKTIDHYILISLSVILYATYLIIKSIERANP